MIRSYYIKKVTHFISNIKHIGYRQTRFGHTCVLRNLFQHTHSESNSTIFSSKPNSTSMSSFKLSDYDCIGFDLDHTLLRYNITNLALMEYDILTKYLVKQKGYDPKYLLQPLTDKDLDFMQRGLILDFEKGNILRLNSSGKILRACHGTKLLTVEEINNIYPQWRWSVTDTFCKDVLSTWNGPMSMQMRSLLDYFDFISSLIFAKIVDTLDEEHGKPLDQYSIWPDMLEGFIYMFERKQFEADDGEFFPILKSNPAKYLHKCSPQTMLWLQEIKRSKKTFLITGSNVDFANFTASYAFGQDWKSLFDVVVCYAKKPGFFVNERPFLKVIDLKEHDESVESQMLEQGQVYSQGNWKGLMQLLSQLTNMDKPKCLYIGDNLVQDIFVPSKYSNCDTIAVINELMAEGMLGQEFSHPDEKILNSKIWGSFFCVSDKEGSSESLWAHIIQSHAKLCIPDIDLVSSNSIEMSYTSFHENDLKCSGYYPTPSNWH